MTLTLSTFYDSDTAGATETIDLAPNPPATTTLVTIAAVAYNGVAVPVDPSGLSFKFQVLAGFNLLTVGLISPTYTTETVQLMQDANQIALVTMGGHGGSAQIYIKGN